MGVHPYYRDATTNKKPANAEKDRKKLLEVYGKVYWKYWKSTGNLVAKICRHPVIVIICDEYWLYYGSSSILEEIQSRSDCSHQYCEPPLSHACDGPNSSTVITGYLIVLYLIISPMENWISLD